MSELRPVLPPTATKAASEHLPEEVNLSRLHGQNSPRWDVAKELPWHRQAAHLFATASMTAKAVAEVLEKDTETVRNLMKVPWFQERVTAIMADAGGGMDVMAMFRAEALSSLATLVELRDDTKAPKAVRRASAIDILDRGYGKPKMFMEHTDGVRSDDPVAERARLLRENERLEK